VGALRGCKACVVCGAGPESPVRFDFVVDQPPKVFPKWLVYIGICRILCHRKSCSRCFQCYGR
jgi:hypothetical protein